MKTTTASLMQYTNILKLLNDFVNAIFCLGSPWVYGVMVHKTIMRSL